MSGDGRVSSIDSCLAAAGEALLITIHLLKTLYQWRYKLMGYW